MKCMPSNFNLTWIVIAKKYTIVERSYYSEEFPEIYELAVVSH